MTPDEIRDFLAREYPHLVSRPREEPGWSFHYPGRQRVRRILRATRRSTESGTKLLLSISSKLGKEGALLEFDDGNEERLKQFVTKEIRLYEQHFRG